MQLFYNPEINSQSKKVVFGKEESRHIVKVLRKKPGDSIEITDGNGNLYLSELTLATASKCVATIISHTHFNKRPYALHMAVAPTKMNDRFEWFLEKATEIGIDFITPIICDHSERKVIKPERYEKIIESAMKQSLNFYKPVLNEAISFKDFIGNTLSGEKYIAHCEDSERHSLKDAIKSSNSYIILIGPEGDFSVKEIEMALQHKFKPVTLGQSRLRTETAAIVACHTVSFINQ